MQPAIHPGAHLARVPRRTRHQPSAYRLAKATGVPPRRINEIVHGRRAITADTALRLGQAFRMRPGHDEAFRPASTPEFWLNLQRIYDLDRARAETNLPAIEPLVAKRRLRREMSERETGNLFFVFAPGHRNASCRMEERQEKKLPIVHEAAAVLAQVRAPWI